MATFFLEGGRTAFSVDDIAGSQGPIVPYYETLIGRVFWRWHQLRLGFLRQQAQKSRSQLLQFAFCYFFVRGSLISGILTLRLYLNLHNPSSRTKPLFFVFIYFPYPLRDCTSGVGQVCPRRRRANTSKTHEAIHCSCLNSDPREQAIAWSFGIPLLRPLGQAFPYPPSKPRRNTSCHLIIYHNIIY